MATYIIDHHDELLGIGRRKHPAIDTDLDNLLERVAILEARRWYRFETLITSEMVDAAVQDETTGRWSFYLPLGQDPQTGLALNYKGFSKMSLFITGMQQDVGRAATLTPDGLGIWVQLPENQTLWARYRSGIMPLALEWFK